MKTDSTGRVYSDEEIAETIRKTREFIESEEGKQKIREALEEALAITNQMDKDRKIPWWKMYEPFGYYDDSSSLLN